jgi:hypothetical protein
MIELEQGEDFRNRKVKLVVFIVGDNHRINNTAMAEVEIYLKRILAVILCLEVCSRKPNTRNENNKR